ncbi:hypothetical protein BH23GEM10_BH23GEM10_02950 [soil metagenome]
MPTLIGLLVAGLMLVLVAIVLEMMGLARWLVWPTIITALVVVASITIVYRVRRTYFGGD